MFYCVVESVVICLGPMDVLLLNVMVLVSVRIGLLLPSPFCFSIVYVLFVIPLDV